MAGREVARVIQRVEEAKEFLHLDLSDCQLMHMPEAVFFMLHGTPLVSINMSLNFLSNAPEKISTFIYLTKLDLSSNKLQTLPESMHELKELESLKISDNEFRTLPTVLMGLPNLKEIDASRNKITVVDDACLSASASLKLVNLEGNPVTDATYRKLRRLSNPVVRLNRGEQHNFFGVD